MSASAEATQTQKATVVVPEWQLDEFEQKLAQLNAKAKTFGLPAIVVSARREVVYVAHTDLLDLRDGEAAVTTLSRYRPGAPIGKNDQLVKKLEMDIDYPIVKLGDWEIAAQIEASVVGTNETANLVYQISKDANAVAAAEQLRQCPIRCEHCEQKRARKSVFLLREAGTDHFKQVGNSCLEDFTGINPAAALFLAKMVEVFKGAQDRDELYGLGGAASYELTNEYLARTLFSIKHYGFVSTSKADDTGDAPTYLAVESGAFFRALQQDQLLNEWADTSGQLIEQAHALRQYYAEKESTDPFDLNLKVLLSSDILKDNRKHRAYVAGSVPGYLRHLAQTDHAATKRTSTHIGDRGEKLKRALQVQQVITSSTQWGVSHRILMTDADDNVVMWRTGSRSPLLEAHNQRRQFLAECKVKDHSEYRETKQTEVTNLKIREWLAPPTHNPHDRGHYVGLLPAKREDEAALAIQGVQISHYREDKKSFVVRIPECAFNDMIAELRGEALETLNKNLFWMDRRMNLDLDIEGIARTSDMLDVQGFCWEAHWANDQARAEQIEQIIKARTGVTPALGAVAFPQRSLGPSP